MKKMIAIAAAILLAVLIPMSGALTQEPVKATAEVAQCAIPSEKGCATTGEFQVAKSGCCSWHGGVCGCSGGRAVCCDGQFSPSCGC